MTAMELAHDDLRSELKANSMTTAAVKADTELLVEFTKALKGFVTFCKWFGRMLRWIALYIAPVVTGGLAVWAIVTGKKIP